MKGLHPRGSGSIEAGDRANGAALRKKLTCEEVAAACVGDAHLRPIPFPPLSQHDRPLRFNGTIHDVGIDHHARENFHALAKAGRCRLRKVERIGGAGGRRLRIAVAAEGNAQPLPYSFGLAIGHMARSAEGQMLHEVRIALLIGLLHQGADIHAQADGDLPRRNAIAANGIAQAIGQGAEVPCRIDRHVAIFIEPRPDLRLRIIGSRRRLCRGRASSG